jgi:hypothetical protein
MVYDPVREMNREVSDFFNRRLEGLTDKEQKDYLTEVAYPGTARFVQYYILGLFKIVCGTYSHGTSPVMHARKALALLSEDD